MNRSDVQLLVAARTDPQAFGEFYRRHAIAVERWLQTQTPDRATAADLTAETFAQALVSLKRFRGTEDEQAIAWLFGIARNLVRRFHRRGRAELQMCRRLGFQLDHDPDELARLEARIDVASDGAELSDALSTPQCSTPGAAAEGDRSARLPQRGRVDGHQRAERSHSCLACPESSLLTTARSNR